MDDMWIEVGYKDVLDLTKVVFPLDSPEPRKDICEFEGAREGAGDCLNLPHFPWSFGRSMVVCTV